MKAITYPDGRCICPDCNVQVKLILTPCMFAECPICGYEFEDCEGVSE